MDFIGVRVVGIVVGSNVGFTLLLPLIHSIHRYLYQYCTSLNDTYII